VNDCDSGKRGHDDMLKIRKYENTDWESVKRLGVHIDQVKYVGTIAELFTEKPAHWNFHVIEVDGEIVGFLNIDTGYASHYDFANESELGLRAFFIGAAHQGKGYGKDAVKVLREYLKDNYTEYNSISLTVNCENLAAYKCYLGGGFEDTGNLYYGGSAGPQHIMRMSIGA
jgi:RimJ/RimL family protein N-acetyltransferase